MKIRRFIFPFLAASFASVLLAQTAPSLSPREKAMVAYIDANEQASNALLEKLVNINSGTHNLEGVRAVAEIMQQQLTDLGFKVRWIPMDRSSAPACWSPSTLPRAGQMRQAHAAHRPHGHGV